MSYIAPILLLISLALACFTAPDGNGIWISPSQVVSVSHGEDCAAGANAKINTAQGSFCVHESPQQVLKVLEQLK